VLDLPTRRDASLPRPRRTAGASPAGVEESRLREGLDLVRIGRPLRPEFAACRYGDQFGRRRRRWKWMLGAGVAGGVVAAATLSPTLPVVLFTGLVSGELVS
jgi:uncharacterized protein (DUF2237 family)